MRTEYDIMAERNCSSLRKRIVTVAGICASWPTTELAGRIWEPGEGLRDGGRCERSHHRLPYEVRSLVSKPPSLFFKLPKSVDGTVLTSCVGGIDPPPSFIRFKLPPMS